MKIQLSLILFIILSSISIFAEPVPISNIYELQNINQYTATGDFYLTNDIDASDTKNWNEGRGFFPLSLEFGSFNGNGYKIINLYINRPDNGPGIGLFNYVYNFTIKNLILENVNISSGDHEDHEYVDVAGLAAESKECIINNVKVTGYLKGGNKENDYTGGIIGWDAAGTKITNCIVEATIKARNQTGGIVGELGTDEEGLIDNCFFRGTINGEYNVGGIAGNTTGKITNSSAEGTIKGKERIGGIIGDQAYDTVTNCSFNGNVEGDNYVGGIAGKSYENISNSSTQGNIKGINSIGGITGETSNGEITNCSFNGIIDGDSIVGGISGQSSTSIKNSSSYGTINGNNKIGGIAGIINTQNIDNCSFNGNINANEFVGGIAGYCFSSIENSKAQGNIKGKLYIGGITGITQKNYFINNCSYNGNLQGDQYIGGVVGLCRSLIKNSTAKGSIEGNLFLGGIIGFFELDNFNPVFLENTFYNYNSMLFNGKYALTPGAIYNDQYKDWINNGKYLSISNYPNLVKLKPGHFQISSIDGLKDLLGFSQHKDKTWYLMKNINFLNEDKFFIPYLIAREFNGNGYKILNFHSKPQTNLQSFGFIGIFSGTKEDDPTPELESSIKNLKFVNTVIDLSKKQLKNINIGGVFGSTILSNIENIHTFNTIINTYFEVSDSIVGGIIGNSSNCKLNNSSFFGIIKNINENFNPLMGGICGKAYSGEISKCKATSKVTGSTNGAQGFGEASYTTIDNCYSNSNAGIDDNLFIYKATGALIANYYAIGKNATFIKFLSNNYIVNCFWDKTYAGKPSDYVDPIDGVTALPTILMCFDFMYTNWDFENIWTIQGTYPVLKWQVTQTNSILNIKDNIKQIKLGSKEPEELKPILKSYYN